MANFEQLKIKYDNEHQNILAVNCFLPVHLTYDKQETSLYKKDGSYNEQYYRGFNINAGIYELDKSMKYLQSKLEQAIECIADDEEVDISF